MSFADYFLSATGHAHFPWQSRLFKRCIAGDPPSCVDIPSGLGKTSVVAVWLIAVSFFQHGEGRAEFDSIALNLGRERVTIL